MTAKSRGLAVPSLLGLPIALFAHALVFGGEHAAGGALSSAVLAAGTLGLLFVIAIHSNDLVQGSVLATRMREQMPSFAALAASASVWFAAVELCERAHTMPLIAVVAAIAGACIIVRLAVCAIAHSIAQVAIVLTRAEHARVLAGTHTPLTHRAPRAIRSFAHTRRLFSRPPPALS